MAKTDFSWVNACDTATYMAGSEAATLPSANLASPRTGRVWRSLATTSYFIATFQGPTPVAILALGSATIAATDTVRHRLYDAAGAVLLDTGFIASGVLPGYGLHVYKLAAVLGTEAGAWLMTEGGDVIGAGALTVSSWRCDIVATSRGSAGYFDIGRAWAAPVLQPVVGISRPWDEGWNDDATITRGKLSGGVFAGDGPQYRTLNVALDWISDSEKAQLKEMQRLVGKRYQVLIVPDEDGDIPREAILGRLSSLQPFTNSANVVPPVYGQKFSVTQDL